MNTLFIQSIAQFAPLRACTHERALVCASCQYAQLIHELFPKALFHERDASCMLFFEIAWSFLSPPTDGYNRSSGYVWNLNGVHHRIGGLPAITTPGMNRWYNKGNEHRDDKDSRTGLTLPSFVVIDFVYYAWCVEGKEHRDDKDPRTGLMLPSIIRHNGQVFEWYKNGGQFREDRDPITNLALPTRVKCVHVKR